MKHSQDVYQVVKYCTKKGRTCFYHWKPGWMSKWNHWFIGDSIFGI
jgi:hypothetical protein